MKNGMGDGAEGGMGVEVWGWVWGRIPKAVPMKLIFIK